MIIVLGLLILVVAVVVAVAGVLGNTGHGHSLTHGFAVFGYHVTGSTGTLFLYGVVVGAIAVFGLSLLLTGARRTSRRGHAARGELKRSRLQTAAFSQDRDTLIDQRDTARADTVAALRRNGSLHGDRPGGRLHHLFGRRPQEAAKRAPSDQVQPTGLEPAGEQVVLTVEEHQEIAHETPSREPEAAD